MLVLIYAVNLPWAIRNYRTWHKPIYFSATGGYVYSVFNPLATGIISQLPAKGEPYYSEAYSQAKSEGEGHMIGMAMAKKWIRENPATFVSLTIQKALWLMSPDNFEWAVTLTHTGDHERERKVSSKQELILTRIERIWYSFFLYGFFFLLLVSLFVQKKAPTFRNRAYVTFLLSILGTLAGYALLYAFAKYRFPVEPLMMVLTIYLAINLWGIFAAKTPSTAKAPAAFIS